MHFLLNIDLKDAINEFKIEKVQEIGMVYIYISITNLHSPNYTITPLPFTEIEPLLQFDS